MSSFHIEPDKINAVGTTMDEIARELRQIGQEIDSVKNNLDLSNGSTEFLKGAMAKIQNSLQTEASGSGAIGNALREAVRLYDQTDKMLAGISVEDNRSLFERAAGVLERVRNWIRRLLELFGVVTAGTNEGSAYVGDPVNACTGNYVSDIRELCFSGKPALSFVRHYNSLYMQEGSMGRGWSHNYEISLERGEGTLDLIMGDQWRERFICREEGVYTSCCNRHACIAVQEEGYTYFHESGIIYRFDAEGRIARISLRNGRGIIFSYENGKLSQAQDSGGRSIYYGYDEQGHLNRVSDNTGRRILMEYPDGVLTRVVSADGREKTYAYDEEGRLQSITDNAGTMVIWNRYDDENRVVLQRLPNGTVMTYDYDGENVTVTDRNGAVTTYQHNERWQITDIIRSDGTKSFVYDDNHQRTGVVLPDGASFRKEYDEEGNITGLIDPLENRISIRYEQKGLPSEIVEKDGGSTRMEYDENGNIILLEDALGNVTRFEYERDLLTRVIHPDLSEELFERDENGNIIRRVDEAGRSTLFAYDEAGRMIRRTDPGDQVSEYSYDPCDRILSVKNPAGYVRFCTYSETGKIASVRDFDGTLRQWSYNELDLVSAYVDRKGSLTTYTYDENGNLAGILFPGGSRITHSYDGYNRRISTVDELGLKTVYEYDADDRLVCERQGETERRMEYDRCGRLVKLTERNGGISCVERDAMGRVTQLTRADGSRFSYEYDRKGRCSRRTDAAGAVTEYRYDSRDRLTEIREEGVPVRCYTWYPDGRIRTARAANGSSLSYTYDGAGDLVRSESGTGYVTEYGYDCLHRRISMRDSVGQSMSFAYDPAGHVTEQADAEGNVSRYAYSASGKILSAEDAAGGVVWYEYDEMDRLSGIFSGEGEDARNTVFERNARGQLTRIENAEGLADRYTYDEYGRMILHETPENMRTGYSYDAAGNVSAIQYADGRSLRMTHDLLGRLTALEDWNGRMEVDYDAMGRATRLRDSSGNELHYQWDHAGRRTFMQYPDGKEVFFEYNKAGQMEEIRTHAGSIYYSYDGFGRLTAKKAGQGSVEYASGPDGRIREIAYYDRDGKHSTLTLRYDARGNVSGKDMMKHREGGLLQTSYTYDAIGRVTKVCENGRPVRTYAYDAFGNRIHETNADAEIDSQYNRLNQLISRTIIPARGGQAGPRAQSDGDAAAAPLSDPALPERILWTYNRDGHLVTRQGRDSSLVLNYDASGKLTGVRKADGSRTTYCYDGLGICCGRQTVKGSEIIREQFVYDHTQPHMPMVFCREETGIAGQEELSPGQGEGFEKQYGQPECIRNKMDAAFIRDGEMAAELRDDELRFYECDQQGSVLRYLSAEGRPLQEYCYDEFGLELSGSAGRIQRFGYTGLVFDGELDGWQTPARTYSPRTGRFLQKDRERYIHIAEPQSVNLYTYCLNNPLLYVDPDGTDCYIFYLPEWRDEALNDQQRLAEQYGYGTDRVHLVPVTNRRELTDGWNEMGTVDGHRVDIETVVINTHADPESLVFSNGSHFTRRNAGALQEKEMDNLFLYGCNAGHLDYRDNNIAAAFSRRTNGAPVLASDGTVYGMNEDETYTPRNDPEFQEWADRAGNGGRGNEGWQVYRQVDGQTVVTDTGMYAATVVAMLDTLRSMTVKENAE